MITISKTTKKETKEFDKTAWSKANIKHYGKSVQWKEVKFRFKAKSEEKIIATALGKFESGATFIDALIVDESARKSGVGKLGFKKIANFPNHYFKRDFVIYSKSI
jgi:hypothetical protein